MNDDIFKAVRPPTRLTTAQKLNIERTEKKKARSATVWNYIASGYCGMGGSLSGNDVSVGRTFTGHYGSKEQWDNSH